MTTYECGVRDCDAQLASNRPVKLWHKLDGSHVAEYLDQPRAITTRRIVATLRKLIRHHRSWGRACAMLDELGFDRRFVDELYLVGVVDAAAGWRLCNALRTASPSEIEALNSYYYLTNSHA